MKTEHISVLADTLIQKIGGIDLDLMTMILYGGLLVLLAVTLFQWHRSKIYDKFSLLDLFAENGVLSARKFFESNAFIITSIAFIMHVLKSGLTEGMLLAYAGLWIVGRTAGQIVHSRSDTGKE